MKAYWWRCFKGVSSLSDLCLAWNVDDLLDDVTGLVGFFLVPESDESYKDVSNESSNDYEEKESENFQYISVLYGYILVPLRVPSRILRIVDIQ